MSSRDRGRQDLLAELQALRQRVAELERAVEAHERAEKALAESERRYRLFAENASDLIWTMTLDGRPTYVSPSVTSLTGYSVDEAMGVTLDRQLTPASYRAAMETLAEALAEIAQAGSGTAPPSRTLEVEIIRKDGSTFWAEAHVNLLLGSDGQPAGIVGVTRDISERRRLEEQAFRVQKMETIGRVAGGIAHDFNNLLTGIIGHASFARDALPADEPARQDIEQVLRAAERAGSLIRQLLAFSRSQALAPQMIDLNALVLDLDRLLRRLLGEDVELVIVPASDLGLVQADPGQMEQVVFNLAVNARDAMPDGGTLTIETANVTIDEDATRSEVDTVAGPFVMLAIRDTGVGMTDEVKAHLFEPFFTTKDPGRGTGLGLATAFGIIRQHQGRICVDSAPGRGAAFRIYLPRVQKALAEERLRYESPALPGGTETVLLVEDDPLVRGLAGRTLRTLGYTVLEAAHGEQALRAAAAIAGPIDVLVADVVMPRMNGAALAARLQALYPGLRVLFLSGYTLRTIGHYGIPEDAAFLQKPFTAAALARTLRGVLDA